VVCDPRLKVIDLHSEECMAMMRAFIASHPEIWNEDIGEE
jgi:cytosine deaminase